METIHFTAKKHIYEGLLAGTQRELYLPINALNEKRIGQKDITAKVRCGNLCARYTISAIDRGYGNPLWGANKHTLYVRVNIAHRILENEETLTQGQIW